MIMKAKRFFMGMMLALCLAAPAVASGLGDIRVNARFLTDRMAFELNLTQTQYNDLYEVNYDFFSGIDPYVSAMARQEAYALDAYYRYLDERNDDLRWVLSSAEYVRFMALEYFFRPVYVLNRVCSRVFIRSIPTGRSSISGVRRITLRIAEGIAGVI